MGREYATLQTNICFPITAKERKNCRHPCELFLVHFSVISTWWSELQLTYWKHERLNTPTSQQNT